MPPKPKRLAPPTEALPQPRPNRIADIRAFYALGKQSHAELPGRVQLKDWKRHTAGERERIYRARTFASRYTPKQLDDLCRLIRANGAPTGVTHIARLMDIPTADCRDFVTRAVAKKWSLRQLTLEVRKRYGHRRVGVGRPPEPPQTAADAAVRLVMGCERAERLLRYLSDDAARWLRPALRTQIKSLLPRLEKLRKAAEAELHPAKGRR